MRRCGRAEFLGLPMLRSRTLKIALGLLLTAIIQIGAPRQSRAAERLIGTSCTTGSSNVDYDTIGECVSTTFQRVSPFLAGSIAIGTTSLTSGTSLDLGSNTNSMLLPVGTTGQEPSPATAGMMRFNSTTLQVEAYNSAAWAALVQSQVTPVETAPSGSGYFVLTGTTYNGNLGGQAGADANCVTELTTTNTGWLGYSTANANGQLTASKIRAFLCYSSAVCTNLMPLTTYYFANAASSSAGGAFFTTDSTGVAPNDSNSWAAANYFSGSYTYWTSRAGGGSNTVWTNTGASAHCSGFTTASSGVTGGVGQSANTNVNRWGNSSPLACNGTLPLICFVNP